MSISEELRQLCSKAGIYSNSCYELRELADRIDLEMVELPRDKDGVPIHVGDTVYMPSGRKSAVTKIHITPGVVTVTCNPSDETTNIFFPVDISHTRPDSLERIADELDEQAGSLTKDGYTWQEDAIHVFADRIRKLAEKEDE